MEKKWNALSKEEQKIVDEVFKYGRNQGKRAEASIEQMRRRLGLNPKRRVPFFVTPYVPLVRQGDILITYKSNEYLAIDKQIDDMTEELAKLGEQSAKLRKDGYSSKAVDERIKQIKEDRQELKNKRSEMRKQEDHYVVSFEKSNIAAGELERKLQEKYGAKGKVERRVIAKNSVHAPNEQERNQLLEQVRQGLKASIGEETAQIVGREFMELYSLTTEKGLNDATRRRENISGYEKNIMAGFVEHNIGLANRIANADMGLQVAEKLAACRTELQGLSGAQQREATAYFNELERRVHNSAQYQPSNAFDKFSSGAARWRLSICCPSNQATTFRTPSNR